MDKVRRMTKYLRCVYCGQFYPMESPSDQGLRHDQYPNRCPVIPLTDDDSSPCYSCNSSTNLISQSQRSRYGWKARCKKCIDSHIVTRFEHFPYDNDIIELLHDSVGRAHIQSTGKLLRKGADPNGKRQLTMYDELSSRGVRVWNADGSPYPDTEIDQPTTPLKLVVFRISDCLLEDADLERFRSVAKLLINAGADRNEAISFAKHRYGEECFEDTGSPFDQVLQALL